MIWSNGRVETAYLPSGYVPVGIKEYGGIIYVASYNPLTNKGQIGSFRLQSVILVVTKFKGHRVCLLPVHLGAV